MVPLIFFHFSPSLYNLYSWFFSPSPLDHCYVTITSDLEWAWKWMESSHRHCHWWHCHQRCTVDVYQGYWTVGVCVYDTFSDQFEPNSCFIWSLLSSLFWSLLISFISTDTFRCVQWLCVSATMATVSGSTMKRDLEVWQSFLLNIPSLIYWFTSTSPPISCSIPYFILFFLQLHFLFLLHINIWTDAECVTRRGNERKNMDMKERNCNCKERRWPIVSSIGWCSVNLH